VRERHNDQGGVRRGRPRPPKWRRQVGRKPPPPTKFFVGGLGEGVPGEKHGHENPSVCVENGLGGQRAQIVRKKNAKKRKQSGTLTKPVRRVDVSIGEGRVGGQEKCKKPGSVGRGAIRGVNRLTL